MDIINNNKIEFQNINEIIQFPNKGIFSKVIAKGINYNYSLMCLSSGTDIEEHTSAKAGIVHVLKGKGTFILFDQKIEMHEGVIIHLPANAPHSLSSKNNLAILLCLTKP
ncbi:MAG: cupin domain-containing protein [Candidatus Woesearchaeota archaeon]